MPCTKEHLMLDGAATSATPATPGTPGASSRPVPEPRISNVVATFTCGKTLNLLRFAQNYSFEFQPSRFAACAIRIKNATSRSTSLAFSSGKFVVTGCRSEAESLLASRKYISLLNRLGERLSFIGYRVQNIVSSVDLGRPLLLHQLVNKYTDQCSWENRKFPGAILRDPKSHLVVLVFRSGKCVITGAKSKRQLTKEWPPLFRKIEEFIDFKNDSKCSREYAIGLRREAERMPFDGDSIF
jgi:transcription initiation factor TFIID TATA-box-binding protein